MTARDRARLATAERAQGAEAPDTVAGLKAHIRGLEDGIAAIQSLDDMGPSANEAALETEASLWKELRAAEAKLELLTKAAP